MSSLCSYSSIWEKLKSAWQLQPYSNLLMNFHVACTRSNFNRFLAFYTILIFANAFLLHFSDWNLFYAKKTPRKYVGYHLGWGRLGNQLFHLITGYGIARTLHRTHYLPSGRAKNHVERYLIYIAKVFPRLRHTYVFADIGVAQTEVKFADRWNSYSNPLRLNNLTDQYLLLNNSFLQNRKYFEGYLRDIRSLLKFSEEVRKNGIEELRLLKNHTESMCVHVRMTDFIQWERASDMNSTVKAARSIAKKMNISHFMIFGDDKEFMANMSQAIVSGEWRDDAVIVSHYEESIDLFLASQICSSFLISAPTSTFGWWLAFFVSNQNAVYYLNGTHARGNLSLKKDMLLKSWRLYTD
ncbi:unnamed protein product [Cylicocyclus nassatus]|uniref:L-Fucosyltransferase n=1 Tax=Cylicocyclus nassatus TaxID=53992 RepID=A0AA36MDQ5_CYLNA|nr:unnamed protein product [Cylicocyclus nassatus]